MGHFRAFVGILGHFWIWAFGGIARRWGPRGRPPPLPHNPPTIMISLPLILIYNAPSIAAATAAAFLSDPGRDRGEVLGACGEQRIGSSSDGGGIVDEDEG